MSAEFDALTASVAQEQTVEGSIETMLAGFFAQLGTAPTPAQVLALKSQVDANIATMTAAITANTAIAPPATAA